MRFPSSIFARPEYLNYDISLELFRTVHLFCAEPLFIGTYDAAMEYPLGFDSTIPERLGLPPLPPGSNKAEGVVIKPLTPLWMEPSHGEKVRVDSLKLSRETAAVA